MAYNNLGVAAMKKGAVEEAARAFEKAVELDPKAKDALVNLGSLRTVLGRRKDALALFLQASELDPKDGVLHNNIAVLYFQEGSIQEAWNHTQKALALGAKVDPTFLEALYKTRRRGPCAG